MLDAIGRIQVHDAIVPGLKVESEGKRNHSPMLGIYTMQKVEFRLKKHDAITPGLEAETEGKRNHSPMLGSFTIQNVD